MSVANKQLFGTLLLATMWHATYAAYNVTAYCTLVKVGTKLASTDSCSEFFACTNPPGSYDTRDCGSGYFFDKDKQSCQYSTNVECYHGLDNPCVGKTQVYVPVFNVCGGWLYCLDGQVKSSGTCGDGKVLLKGECVDGRCLPNATPEEDYTLICNIMPINMWFGSTGKCETYSICREGRPLPDSDDCSDLVFDTQLQYCNYKTKTDCSRLTGEDIPGSVGPEKCVAADKNLQKPNPYICSSYLVCDGMEYVAKYCDAGQYYNVREKICVPRTLAFPVETCNRCEGTDSEFVNAVDYKCMGYQVCKNGKKTDEGVCKEAYFDEDYVACMMNAPYEMLQNYMDSHGACKQIPARLPCYEFTEEVDCKSFSDCDWSGNPAVCTEGTSTCICAEDQATGECYSHSDSCTKCGYNAAGVCAECGSYGFVCEDCVCKIFDERNCINVGLVEGSCDCGFDDTATCGACEFEVTCI